MRIHAVQHVPFEGLGTIEEWVRGRGHTLTHTLAASTPLPDPSHYDLIVIMGGPMNIYEEDLHPWLIEEKRFVSQAISAGKGVLGVCLGAQLVADVLGGTVGRNAELEVGWFPVRLTAAGKVSPVFNVFPDEFAAGHWHGDTFEVPPGAIHLASSSACANQAFEYDGGRVIGMQFHLEWSREALRELVEHAGDELYPGEWVQSTDSMLSGDAPIERAREVLFKFLDAMERRLQR